MSWAIVGLVCFLVVYAIWIEPRWLKVRRYRAPLPGLTHPLRCVVASDLQPNAFHWKPERLGAAFAALNDEAPDVIIWLGDYHAGPTKWRTRLAARFPALHRWVLQHLPVMEEIAFEMGRLQGAMGQVAVLGERDWAWSGAKTMQELTRANIEPLDNAVIDLEHPDTGQMLQIVGYGGQARDRGRLFRRLHAELNPAIPSIGICHNPDLFPTIRNGPSALLAGHTHGGQVRIPLLGPLHLPTERRLFDHGWFREWDRDMFITSGIGTGFLPVRLFCRPEIAVIDFHPPGA